MSVAATDITVRYGRTIAVDAVSLMAEAGTVTALVGPNGSGKSSLVKALAGVIRFEGKIALPKAPSRGRVIGYMPQDTQSATALTVLETVVLGRLGQLNLRLCDTDVGLAAQALADLGIGHLAARDLGELSGGQRQLVFLAQALSGNPKVLLLDEPISALDIHHQLHVLQNVNQLTRRLGLTTIMVLHDLTAAARHADRVAVMDRGRLAGIGSPTNVLTPALIRAVFQVEATVTRGADDKPIITALACAHKPGSV